jgi:hypothetical protein
MQISSSTVSQCKGSPLADHKIRVVVHIRQRHSLCAKIQIQECLLGFDWWEACIMIGDACAHALKGRMVQLEHDNTHIETPVPDMSEMASDKRLSKLC